MTVWDEWNYPCSCFWVSLAPDGIGGEYSDTWTMSIIMKIIMKIMVRIFDERLHNGGGNDDAEEDKKE